MTQKASRIAILIVGLAMGYLWQGVVHTSKLGEMTARLKGENQQIQRAAEIKERELQRKVKALQTELRRLAPASAGKDTGDEVEVPSGQTAQQPEVDVGSFVGAASAEESPSSPLALQQEQNYEDSIEYLIDSRVGAIGRIVSLSTGQEERLRVKFSAEREAALAGRIPDTESLQKILGEEYLEFYESQKAQAFEKNREEEVKKQVLFLSDMLEFSPDQEITLQSMFSQIEKEIEERQKKSGKSIQELVASSRYRQAKRLARIANILNADQLKRYAEYAANSPDSDMVMWHAPKEE